MSVPADVLRADPATRLNWYERRVFEHPRMVLARTQLLAALGAGCFRTGG